MSDDVLAVTARVRGRWRAPLSATIIVLAALLVPVSIVAGWARVQLVDEDAFVQTLAPLADDPAVQALVVDQTMGAIGLPALTAHAVTQAVESDAFAAVWATTTRVAHRALTTAATSDGGGVVVQTPEGLGIQLGGIVAQVKDVLVARGVGVAPFIPTVDRVVIISAGTQLGPLRTGYAVAAVAGWWLPVLTLALLAAGVLLARRRSVAVRGAGIAVALGAGALAMAFSIGATAASVGAAQAALPPAGVEAIYAQLVGGMARTAVVVCILGVVTALAGWLLSGSRAARAAR